MHKASPGYLLGGASLFSTIIVTVLDGVCYISSRALTPDNSFIEAVIVSFSTISCSVVLALMLILANDLKIDARLLRQGWRTITYGTGIGYLIVAAGVTAGGLTWNALEAVSKVKKSNVDPYQQALFISRCVLWAISVLSQGMLCGVLLTTITNHDSRSQWPTLISYELSTITPSRSEILQKGTSYTPSSIADSQSPSVDTISRHQSSVSRETSRRSVRYSGRTLIQSDSKPNSFELDYTTVSFPESATTRTKIGGYHEGQASEDNQSRPQHLQRSTSQIKRSLDSVMLRASSTLSSSTLSEAAKQPPSTLKLPDESNIHPLFRSGTRSPPPTATPSTMVVAAPDAGQTITVKTLQRMRSTRSFGTYTSRRKSPLLAQTDHLFEDVEHRAGSISSYANSERA
ncbi:uncharacterized protein DSM5745_05660 [Aspergillus mulundensis]|uniref:Uncharacterized protein n=1 Tax=Aspergillus mulundensis TaxID=1810919 RepID=A0A3D8RXS5_9EURO|nr:Uncharacterized protein DSM5745_05660 [Aspergillus mulundensis]RDW78808.1 Uncharacterized protein DSM5745_05660 [Aspergillus mulundensis]